MQFSWKMWLIIILKVTKNQGFNVSLKNKFLEKPQWGQIDPPIPSHFRVKTRLITTIKKHITFTKLRFIFQTSNRFKNYFCFKGFFPETWRSSFIFKIFYLVWEFCQKGQFPHIFGRQNISQEHVNQLTAPYQPLLWITCLFETMK